MIYSEKLQGKCISCGYLSIRYKQQHPQIPRVFHLEIDSPTRKNGEVPSSGLAQLACFHRLVDFSAEVSKEMAEFDINRPNATANRIQVDRKCPLWVSYQSGLDPKEHFEEYKMNQILMFQNQILAQNQKANVALAERSVTYARYSLWVAITGLVIVVILSIMQTRLSAKQQPTTPVIFQYKPNTDDRGNVLPRR